MWARFGDDFHEQGDTLALSNEGFRLFVCSVTYCCAQSRSCGFMSQVQAQAICRLQNLKYAFMAELVKAHIWVEATISGVAGFMIHEFSKYRGSKVDNTNAERQARYRKNQRLLSGQNEEEIGRNAVTIGVSNGVTPVTNNAPETVISEGGLPASPFLHAYTCARPRGFVDPAVGGIYNTDTYTLPDTVSVSQGIYIPPPTPSSEGERIPTTEPYERSLTGNQARAGRANHLTRFAGLSPQDVLEEVLLKIQNAAEGEIDPMLSEALAHNPHWRIPMMETLRRNRPDKPVNYAIGLVQRWNTGCKGTPPLPVLTAPGLAGAFQGAGGYDSASRGSTELVRDKYAPHITRTPQAFRKEPKVYVVPTPEEEQARKERTAAMFAQRNAERMVAVSG